MSLHGLFDVKSLEAGTSKYLYVHTYPEEGVKITSVSSSDEGVAVAGYGNNSAGVTTDDVSGRNGNYNYIELNAVSAGNAEISVKIEDMDGNLESKTETFTVQVIDSRYANTERIVKDIAAGWRFRLERDMDIAPAFGDVPNPNQSWEKVEIPHCWNAVDGADGGGDYHKGVAWYVKKLPAGELAEAVYEGKQIYLEIGAACKVSEIYVNNRHMLHHEGGYSLIRADITDAVRLDGENTIAIRVDNRVNDLTPMSGDFTVFGGLYRGIRLIAVGSLHMDLDQETSFGGCGLYVSQRGAAGITKNTTADDVFGQGGKLTVVGKIKNSAHEARKARAAATVYDAEWKKETEYIFDAVELSPGERHSFQQELTIDSPHLWDGTKDPYQYNVVFSVMDEHDRVVDREQVRVGFRFYCVDPEKGFFLNGKSYPLRGVCMHQDRFGKGNAVTHQDREQDIAMIAELGANTIRFAHYQHDPSVYELASERGITAWAEIPMVNEIVNSWDFYESTMKNQNELIYQCFNCTSIIVWGNHNEQWPNNEGINVLLDRLYKNAKERDPSRLVAVATAQPPSDFATDDQMGIALSWQSDVSAWNKYFGLYQGLDARHFGQWVNDVHQYGLRHMTVYGTEKGIVDPDGKKHDIPVKVHGNVGMSEYGVEGNPYIHDENPGYWDDVNNRSEEWQAQWHEIYYKAIHEAAWMWGSYIWNMFEFGSDSRTDPGRQGTNNKGIVSYDRTIKKDVYYFYKANWAKEPVLHICGRRFVEHTQDDINVKVYANMDKVELLLDGVSQGVQAANYDPGPALDMDGQPDDRLIPNTQLGKFVWTVHISEAGAHEITAIGVREGETYVSCGILNRKLTEKVEEGPKTAAAEKQQLAFDAIDFTKYPAEVPISQYMPAYAQNIETDWGIVPNENGADGHYARNINDGDDDTYWSGAFNFDRTKCYYPAAVTIAMTNPKDIEDYYYLTGVKIHFYDKNGEKRIYGYNIYADNIVGIPTGFVVDAADNTCSGWVEHWTEDGTNQIKDLTLNIQRLRSGGNAPDGAAAVCELQVYAWRIRGCKYAVDEIAKTIVIGKEDITAKEFRNGLEIRGNCGVKLLDEKGTELKPEDHIGSKAMLLVTDFRKHTFIYQIIVGS